MSSSWRPNAVPRKQSNTPHYQTFPTRPPTSRGKPPADDNNGTGRGEGGGGGGGGTDSQTAGSTHESPLPVRQLTVLAIVALAEQTALNSISPYLPAMAASFPEVDTDQVGLFVGLIATAFALAQFTTNFFWGWLSDRIGRKPVILMGTFLTAICFVAFGFCRTLPQAIVVQALMGLFNGNQGIVSTCLGEITDRTNQSRAFAYLPVVYGIGGITGPIVGGLLVRATDPAADGGAADPGYPFLLPNLVSAAVLLVDMIVIMFFLDESLEGAKTLKPLGQRVHHLFSWLWQFSSSHRPTYMRADSPLAARRLRYGVDGAADHPPASNNNNNNNNNHRDNDADADGQIGEEGEEEEEEEEEEDANDDNHSTFSLPTLFPTSKDTDHVPVKEVLNWNTALLLVTFLIFQLSNIAYNSLYPIFAQGPPPTGRSLSPGEIGISLAFAGLVTILFQVCFFGRLEERVGNNVTYKLGLAGFVVAFLLMPWVGYKDKGGGKAWLWVELGGILIIKTVAAVGGLTSALLLITNSAPTHSTLGTLNGLAQTLSAAGRATGPLVSGALFSAATHIKPKGEALAFGVFAGISFVGLLLSFGIRGPAKGVGIEDDDDDDEENEEDDDDEQEDEQGGQGRDEAQDEGYDSQGDGGDDVERGHARRRRGNGRADERTALVGRR